MLATFVKLLIYLVAVLAYVFTNKEKLLPFILAFFLLYIFYTVFEVINILSQTKDATGNK
jgi:predicted PurR-regulated permease PerM